MYNYPKVGDLVRLLVPHKWQAYEKDHQLIVVLEWKEFDPKNFDSEIVFPHCDNPRCFEVKGFNSYSGRFVVYDNHELALEVKSE